MVQILRKSFNLMEIYFLGQTNEMGQILVKTVLLTKMSQILRKSFFPNEFEKGQIRGNLLTFNLKANITQGTT